MNSGSSYRQASRMVLAGGFLILATMFLAYTNGANDNFKGVATLLGSGTASYRRALAWATATTFAGALVAMYLGAELVKSFSGKGLVPDGVTRDAAFLGAVACGAAITVLLATRLGFPISTTHAMTGSLIGAGLLATGGAVAWTRLGAAFFVPLLLSPVVALASSLVLYPIFRRVRLKLAVTEETAIGIVGTPETHAVPFGANLPAEAAIPGVTFVLSSAFAETLALSPSLVVGREATLIRRYEGVIVGLNAQQILDVLHYLSAGCVGFARGLNDAPKIVALVVAAEALRLDFGLALVAIAMAFGGLVGARRIAETMATRITAMNSGQAFTANLVTSLLVIGASRFGMPVSTTHVSCGALFGIGVVNGKAHRRMVLQILIAWVTTLPVAIVSSAALYGLLRLLAR